MAAQIPQERKQDFIFPDEDALTSMLLCGYIILTKSEKSWVLLISFKYKVNMLAKQESNEWRPSYVECLQSRLFGLKVIQI